MNLVLKHKKLIDVEYILTSADYILSVESFCLRWYTDGFISYGHCLLSVQLKVVCHYDTKKVYSFCDIKGRCVATGIVLHPSLLL